MITPKFFGSNILWWFGVVEDNDDSTADDKLKLGRCRVRIMGLHSAVLKEDDNSGEGIAVDQLHWAYPITPVTSAAMNGIGESPLGMMNGSVVFGFSFDGLPSQDLYMIGSMGGVPQSPKLNPETEGFCDPSGEFPREKFLGEEDTNRLARADGDVKDETCINTRRKELVKVDIAGGGNWEEPESSYEAVYPFNKVRETQAGHIEEYDDTEGAVRYHRWHPSGTYVEVDNDGNQIRKITGNGFEIIIGDNNLYVHGDINITVDGDANILVKGDAISQVEGSSTMKAKKDLHLEAENILLVSKKKIDLNAGTDYDLSVGRMNSQKSLGAVKIIGSNTKGNIASGII
jgi:hypothetical protein